MLNADNIQKIINDWAPVHYASESSGPAELFDTHPLSLMMLSSENDISKKENYVLIVNSWRSEWHRNGVQVPVLGVDNLPKPSYCKRDLRTADCRSKFRWPSKLWHLEKDERFDETVHCLPDKNIKEASSYHVDDLDYAWMSTVNEERECLGQILIEDWMLEQVMETLEYLSYVKMSEKIKELEVQSLEFDESARCDICQSFEGEDGNELVFCDGCFLCVHQACYGIIKIPEGSWMCRQCEAGVKSTTPCVLCPNTGGAMKLTEDGVRWCHVSCALWVPEVGFGDVELMEPIVRVDTIPQARRSLLCAICRSRSGAPIQCSNKKCKVAFHVTCAFQSNLTMRQELIEKDVRLIGLCPKHSRKDQQHPNRCPPSPNGSTSSRNLNSPNKSITSGSSLPPVSQTRQQRLMELENDFHKLVDTQQLDLWMDKSNGKSSLISKKLPSSSKNATVPTDIRQAIMIYWRLKRRVNFNQPLVNPVPLRWRQTACEAMATTQEAMVQAARVAAEIECFNTFKRIRFGLDRARLVLDMVLQRERRKLAMCKRMWRIFEIQLQLLQTNDYHITDSLVRMGHLGDSIYDNWALYMHYGRPYGSENHHHHHTAAPTTLDQSTPSADAPQSPLDRTPNPPIPKKSPPKSKMVSPMRIKTEPKRFDPEQIPKENLIISNSMRQRLRSALTLVTNNYCYPEIPRSKKKCSPNQRLLPSNTSASAGKSTHKPASAPMSPTMTPPRKSKPLSPVTSSPESSIGSNVENLQFRLPQVTLSPLILDHSLKYDEHDSYPTRAENHPRPRMSSPPKKSRRLHLDQHHLDVDVENLCNPEPILSKLAVTTLSNGTR